MKYLGEKTMPDTPTGTPGIRQGVALLITNPLNGPNRATLYFG